MYVSQYVTHISLHLTSVFILSHVFIRAIPVESKITECLLENENAIKNDVWLTYVRCTAKC